MPEPFTIRPANAADEPFLWAMLYQAANMADDGAASPDAAKDHPYLAKYVRGWGRPGDLGLIAEDGGQALLGAAWLRVLSGSEKNYPVVADGIPEMAIAVRPEQVGRGIGGALLGALLDSARPHYPGVVLSVRAGNPARRLYERHGFATIEEIVNRVGTRSYVMLVRFD